MSARGRMIRRTLKEVKGLSIEDRFWLGEWLELYLGARDDDEKAVRELGEIVAAAKHLALQEPS